MILKTIFEEQDNLDLVGISKWIFKPPALVHMLQYKKKK